MLHDALDDAVLARRVAPFEQHEDPVAALDQMTLKFDQLDLQLPQSSAIAVIGVVHVKRVGSNQGIGGVTVHLCR